MAGACTPTGCVHGGHGHSAAPLPPVRALALIATTARRGGVHSGGVYVHGMQLAELNLLQLQLRIQHTTVARDYMAT